MPARPNLATPQYAAAHFRCTERTLNNWAIKGHVHRYRVPGLRSLAYDLDEIAREIRTNPAMRGFSQIAGTVIEVDVAVPVKALPR